MITITAAIDLCTGGIAAEVGLFAQENGVGRTIGYGTEIVEGISGQLIYSLEIPEYNYAQNQELLRFQMLLDGLILNDGYRSENDPMKD